MTILQYKDPPSSEELKELMLKAFANMGYDTPEKRKQWYDKNTQAIVIFCTRILDHAS